MHPDRGAAIDLRETGDRLVRQDVASRSGAPFAEHRLDVSFDTGAAAPFVACARDDLLVARVEVADVRDYRQAHHLRIELLGIGRAADPARALLAGVRRDLACLRDRAPRE